MTTALSWLPVFSLAVAILTAVLSMLRDFGWKRRQELRDEIERFAESEVVASMVALEVRTRAREASIALSLDLAESARRKAQVRARRLVEKPAPRIAAWTVAFFALTGMLAYVTVTQWAENDAATNVINVISVGVYGGGFIMAAVLVFPGMIRRWRENGNLRTLIQRVAKSEPLIYSDLTGGSAARSRTRLRAGGRPHRIGRRARPKR